MPTVAIYAGLAIRLRPYAKLIGGCVAAAMSLWILLCIGLGISGKTPAWMGLVGRLWFSIGGLFLWLHGIRKTFDPELREKAREDAGRFVRGWFWFQRELAAIGATGALVVVLLGPSLFGIRDYFRRVKPEDLPRPAPVTEADVEGPPEWKRFVASLHGLLASNRVAYFLYDDAQKACGDDPFRMPRDVVYLSGGLDTNPPRRWIALNFSTKRGGGPLSFAWMAAADWPTVRQEFPDTPIPEKPWVPGSAPTLLPQTGGWGHDTYRIFPTVNGDYLAISVSSIAIETNITLAAIDLAADCFLAPAR